ncbi:hypothetical protein HPB50_010577 [Hyalomma asiaticum]|uniref:Uncharacterized protein n=1 Tax=Hyalomma asiaticum TaxID=266040 RepID=A0ACB7SXC0_HYAAI|nr:hypothetical protein HPB50_010577 [Hyalomma asiaticum]
MEIEDYQLTFPVPVEYDVYVLNPLVGPLLQLLKGYTKRSLTEDEANNLEDHSRKYLERAIATVTEFIKDPAPWMPWDNSIIDAYRRYIEEHYSCNSGDTLFDIGLAKVLSMPSFDAFPLDDIRRTFTKIFDFRVRMSQGKLYGLKNLKRWDRSYINATDSGITAHFKIEGGPLAVTYTGTINSIPLDARTKSLFQYFDQLLQSTPAFVTLSGALISDVPSLVDFVPSSATTLVLHVGSNDLARRSALATFQRYRELLDFIHEELPEIRCIYATLVLPRTTNRRRRSDNRAFVHGFNREASRFNSLARSFCGRSRNLSCLDHIFEWLPPGRVLAADGVHLSYEGVALMASHIRQLCFSSPSEATSTSCRDSNCSQKPCRTAQLHKTLPDISLRTNSCANFPCASGSEHANGNLRSSVPLAESTTTAPANQQPQNRAYVSRSKGRHSSTSTKDCVPGNSVVSTPQVPGNTALSPKRLEPATSELSKGDAKRWLNTLNSASLGLVRIVINDYQVSLKSLINRERQLLEQLVLSAEESQSLRPSPNKLSLAELWFWSAPVTFSARELGGSRLWFKILHLLAESSIEKALRDKMGEMVVEVVHQFLGKVELYAINGTKFGEIKKPREDPTFTPGFVLPGTLGSVSPSNNPLRPWQDPSKWGIFDYSVKRMTFASKLDPLVITDVDDIVLKDRIFHIINVTVDGLGNLRRGGDNYAVADRCGINARVHLAMENIKVKLYATTGSLPVQLRMDVRINAIDVVLKVKE